jgi:hypothetical protein
MRQGPAIDKADLPGARLSSDETRNRLRDSARTIADEAGGPGAAIGRRGALVCLTGGLTGDPRRDGCAPGRICRTTPAGPRRAVTC